MMQEALHSEITEKKEGGATEWCRMLSKMTNNERETTDTKYWRWIAIPILVDAPTALPPAFPTSLLRTDRLERNDYSPPCRHFGLRWL